VVCGADAVRVDLPEAEHRDERGALVAVDERLGLGDAVRQDRRLEREVRLLVVRLAARARHCALERFAAPQVIRGLSDSRVEDHGVDLEGVLEDEAYCASGGSERLIPGPDCR